MRLRYTGQQPTSFMAFPYLGEVAPGEFEVRDADAEVLLLRTDVEDADAEAAPDSARDIKPETPTVVKPRKASASKTPEATEPAVTDPTTTA